MYLWNVYCLGLAQCVGESVLSYICSLPYADELAGAAGLDIGVDCTVENEVDVIARVGVLAFATGKDEDGCQQQYNMGELVHHKYMQCKRTGMLYIAFPVLFNFFYLPNSVCSASRAF